MVDKEKQYSRQNDFNRENYDRVSLMLPKGMKQQLKAIAEKQGIKMNSYILQAIQEKMNKENK